MTQTLVIKLVRYSLSLNTQRKINKTYRQAMWLLISIFKIFNVNISHKRYPQMQGL